ncbi:hypothetical protein Dsin_031852 [Dipteronia sinensis]|uniref:Uncharacterized protein n=1 Tax=Dipteronia sinensis TaxID=43782 RepID=A0AAD9ZLU1_9ROSI|nr:hypothetical protein Dsin_031852 [Dipteronia sinensis]
MGGLVEDSVKDDGGEYEINSGSESETFDDDFIKLQYEEIERWGNEDQWDDRGENGLDLVVMEDKETGSDNEGEKRLDHSVALEDEEMGLDDEGEKRLDHSVAMDDEQKQAMKKLKRMNRNKWKMKKPTFEQFNMESDLMTVKLKVWKDYICQPSKVQVYRVKRKTSILIEGSLATQYAKLWDYAEEIRRSNPGSTVVIDTEEGLDKAVMFLRIYI